MESKKTFFMHEPHVSNVKPIRKHNIRHDRVNFLKNFIGEIGKASMKGNSTSLKIPIQVVVKEEVKVDRRDFSKLFPEPKKYEKPVTKPKFYDEPVMKVEVPKVVVKRLPYLPPKVQKHVPSKVQKHVTPKIKPKLVLQDRKNMDMSLLKKRIYKKEGVYYYRPIDEGYDKKYGRIDALIADKDILRISCVDFVVKVDHRYRKNLPTGFKFTKSKDVNKILKKLAEDAGVSISDDNPLLDARIYEGFRVHANYGTDFIEPNFEMTRVKQKY
ncbi:hypothetical protein HOG16_00025 [Candidatus Woesearchaeota archaeon]|jgi:hypothetical protein|nr:hypothetical protein [Candidatus Woesearchaeota archaeon]MBT4630939.1 hypothetical protein [Candidatus Woesearchaeota archaeon]